jgi:hypothetical protein
MLFIMKHLCINQSFHANILSYHMKHRNCILRVNEQLIPKSHYSSLSVMNKIPDKLKVNLLCKNGYYLVHILPKPCTNME